MVVQLVPRELRHRATAVSRVAVNLGVGTGGALGGLVATTSEPATYTALFLVNAATYLVYAGIVLRLPAPRTPARERAGGYARVLRHRPLLPLVAANVLFTAIGWGVLASLVPVFAHDDAGLSEQMTGVLFIANAGVVILAQLPAARLVEGRRRLPMLALMSAVFGLACVLVLAGTLRLATPGTAIALALAAATFAVGECLHGATFTALVADLAPPELLGRAMALVGTSWWLGLTIAPAAGGVSLGLSPSATWAVAAGLSFALALAMLAIEQSVPRELRRTPHSLAAESAA
jgi:MFS family permease